MKKYDNYSEKIDLFDYDTSLFIKITYSRKAWMYINSF